MYILLYGWWTTTNLSGGGYTVFTRCIRAITSQYLKLYLKNVYSQFTMNYKMEN